MSWEQSLTPKETDTVSDAINVLRDAGFAVRDVAHIEGTDRGVEFELYVGKPTKQVPLGEIDE